MSNNIFIEWISTFSINLSEKFLTISISEISLIQF